MIDLLLIKLDKQIILNNDIGKLFKAHTLFEYKGWGDSLSMNVFEKGLAYAYLYASYGSEQQLVNIRDVSLIFVRQAKPAHLFKVLEEHSIKIASETKGIYQIKEFGLLSVNFLVLKEIDFDKHPWLVSLTRSLDKQQVCKLIQLGADSTTKFERDNIESVMEVVIKANLIAFNEAKGDNEMACQALFELMKPEFDEAVNKAVNKAVKQAEEAKDRIIESRDKTIASRDKTISSQAAEIKRLRMLLDLNTEQ